MKKLYLMLLLATLCAGFGFAQVTPTGAVQGIPNQAGILYVSNFGQWQVPPGNLGQYSWKQSSFCYVGIPTGNPVLTLRRSGAMPARRARRSAARSAME